MRPLPLAALGLVVAVPAVAQDNVQAPPVQTSPTLENFSLPPGRPTQTPAPTPTPTPAPTPAATPVAPPPAAVPVPGPPPAAAQPPATTPRPMATPARRAPPPPEPTRAVTASPPPAAVTPAPSATPVVVAKPAPPAGRGGWPWWIVAGVVAAGAAAAVLWRRGRRSDPAPPIAPSDISPPVALPPEPTAAPPGRSLVSTLIPRELRTQGPDAILAFELVVTNHGVAPADGVRAAVALTSAGPDLAAEIAVYQASAGTVDAAGPFTLRSGESYTLGGEIMLAGADMRVNEVGDRAMVIPVAMVALRWRGGLSVRTAGDAFVIGTGDAAAARLGPIWVDRAGVRFAKLDARRFRAD